MSHKNNDTICVSPWGELYIDPDGSVKTCCIAKPENRLGNVNTDSWQDIWNGEKIREIRKSMLNGEKHSNCKHCYQAEKFGNQSLRTELNQKYGDLFESIWEKTNEEGYDYEENIVFLDIRWSNICNFSCRMCTKGLSYKWQQLIDGKKTKPLHINSDKFTVDDLPLDSIKEVYFAGGEPLLMDETYELLQRLIDKGRNNEVSIWIVSNLSLLESKGKNILDYLCKFYKVFFQCSLDGVNEKGEYIRQGMEWSTVRNNLTKLHDFSDEYNNIMVSINYTLWSLNALHLREFVETILNETSFANVDDVKIFINEVQNPWYNNIRLLPNNIKEKIVKSWEKFLEDYQPSEDADLYIHVNSEINNLKDAIKNEPQEKIDKAMHELTKDLYIQDKNYFNTDLFKVFPELTDLWEYYKEHSRS